MTTPATPQPDVQEPQVAFARACVVDCGGALYGFPVAEVREVAELPSITLVPRLPDHVRGVANLRGVMVPVVDPATALGHSAQVPRAVTSAVLLKDGREDVGLAVDRVLGLLPMEDPQPATGRDGDPAARFATGLFRCADRWVVLLDGPALLAALRPPRVRPPELV